MASIFDTIAQVSKETQGVGTAAAPTGAWWETPRAKVVAPKIPAGAGRFGAEVLGRAGRVATAVAPAVEAWKVGATALDPSMSKADVAEQAATGVGQLATAGVGAQAGAALGALGGPAAPITVPLGALAGGALGYWGGGKAISSAKSALGLTPESPYERGAGAPATPAAPIVVAPAAEVTPPVAPVTPTIAAPVALPATPPQFDAGGRAVTISPNVTTIRGPEGQRVITNTGGRMTIPSMDQINNFGGYNMRTYGANFNPQTGRFDTPTGGAPAAPSVQDVVMRKIADIERDPAYQNQSVARLRAIEGLLGALSQGATQRDVANIGATTRGGASPKETAEAARVNAILEAARGAKTIEERNALLTGSAPAVGSPYRFIPGMNPGEVISGDARTGAVTIQRAQPPAQQLREGQTGTMLDDRGVRVPSIVVNGVPVPVNPSRASVPR